jgi:SAM-dependent methyltransferase
MSRLHPALLAMRSTFIHPKYWRFVADFLRFRKLSGDHADRFAVRWNDRYPMLYDRSAATPFDAHYTYHPAWAARIVAREKPALHVDIGSSLAFCTLLSAFIPVEFYDIRPATLGLEGLVSRPGNLMQLPFKTGSVASLSCMHVVEHVGLGRYGDPLDPDGDLKAMRELQRVLASGGSLLFVAPVGKPRLRFNAHRIYAYEQVADQFASLETRQFALVDDRGNFMPHARPEDANRQSYGCGCWWLKK